MQSLMPEITQFLQEKSLDEMDDGCLMTMMMEWILSDEVMDVSTCSRKSLEEMDDGCLMTMMMEWILSDEVMDVTTCSRMVENNMIK